MKTYKCVITREIFDKTRFFSDNCYAKMAMTEAGVPEDKIKDVYIKVHCLPPTSIFDDCEWISKFGDELCELDSINGNTADKILPIEFEVTI